VISTAKSALEDRLFSVMVKAKRASKPSEECALARAPLGPILTMAAPLSCEKLAARTHPIARDHVDALQPSAHARNLP
jgi:hypothetical protein